MVLSELRDQVKPWVEKSAKPFLRLGITPNHITLIALIVGIFAGYLFFLDMPIWAGVVILIGGYFDVLDGTVARLTGKVSKIGGILDSVGDRVTDASLYIGIIGGGMGSLVGEPFWILPSFALIGSYLVSYVRARAESAGSGKLDVGIAERAERLIILAVGAFLGYVSVALVIIVALTIFTIGQRIRVAYLRFEESSQN